ncbi:MAG: alpha-mannosidase [Ignavibacteriales bacterium]|nr:alpha-mannosidase [Ignavibacteriales bacterium]
MALDLLDQILPSVQRHIYPAIVPISDWKIKVGDIPNGFAPSLNDNNWTPITPPQARWGAYDTTFWFRSKVTIPPGFANQPLALLLDFSEGLLFVNGKAHHGLDGHHWAVPLTPRARAGQTYSLAVQAHSGRKKEQNEFRQADLAVVNPTARALHSGLSLLRDLEKFYGQGSPESKEIRELIRRSLIYLKYFKPDGEEYPNAIGRAYRFLTQTLEAEFRTEIPGKIHVLGQSHLDVAWLWTLRETRRKAARTFSSALRLMEEFPEFRFAQSQPLLLDFVKSDHPELYKLIRQRIAEGRWEPVGAMWVEPDCQMPSGESLIRHIARGKRFVKQEFGIDIDTAWLPDSFGFPWSLPQILVKSGIRYFFTTKLSWNDTTAFPYNSFRWQGIDGTQVLAHMPPVGLEGQIKPADFRKNWERFSQQEQLSDVLQTYGHGDGGGGPTAGDLHALSFMQQLPALPTVRITSLKEFCLKLEEHSKELPVWSDDLYLEKHRGTFSTNGRIKKAHRVSERALYTAELLSVLALLCSGRKYPEADLEKSWKRLLQNQFHDILAGTVIQDAAEEALKDFDRIRAVAESVVKSSATVLSRSVRRRAKEFHFSVFNTLPWTRSAYVEVPIKSKERNFRVTDARGKSVEYQIIARAKGVTTILCYVEDIPPVSAVHLTIIPTDTKRDIEAQWKASTRLIETPIYRIRMDSQGNFTSIQDKKSRKEVLKKGQRGNALQSFHDAPDEWEAWDLEGGYDNRKADVLRFKSARVAEEGPLRMTIEVIRRSDRGSIVQQRIQLFHRSPLIEFRTRLVWNDSNILVKAAFPLNVHSSALRCEVPFGSQERTTKPKTPAERAKFEVPVHQWMDISDPKFGVSLLNDGKYGCDAKESTMRLTLIRSPHYPHPIDPRASTDSAVTDQGDQEFSYALYPHQGDWRKAETVRRAREFNHPVLVWSNVEPREFPPLLHSLPSNILADSIKRADNGDGIVIRLHEAHGQVTRCTLQSGFGILQAEECDLMEQVHTKLKTSKGGIPLKFSPFEIKTLRVRFRARKSR